MFRILSVILLLFIFSAGKAQIVNFKNFHYFYPVPYPDKLQAVDLNNDGITDVVAIGEYGIHVLINHLNAPSDLRSYDGPFKLGQITAGDFDGNGFVDIAATGYDSLYVLSNSGNGTFIVSDALAFTGPAMGHLTSADFNKDGKDDIAVGNSFTDNLRVFLANQDGTEPLLELPMSYPDSRSVTSDHGDFNGDGFEDLVLLDVDNASFSILSNNGDGTFEEAQRYETLPYPMSVAVADLNSDNKVDLVVGTAGEPSTVQIYRNTGAVFELQDSFVIGLEYLTTQFLSTGDLNQDDKEDIVFTDWSTGTLNVMINAGGGQFNPTLKLQLGGQPRAIVRGDFNADEKQDLAIGNYSSIQLAYNNGSSFAFVTHGAGYPTSIAHGDFDNDGRADIVTTNVNDSSLSVMLNDGYGHFQTRISYITGGQAYTVKAGDVIGDANLDLIVANIQEDSIALMKGSGDGTFKLQNKFLVGKSPQGIALDDFDGDGTQDIMVLASPISLLLNSTNGFSVPISVSAHDGPRAMSSGDLNGDGLPDLVCTFGSGSLLYLLVNNGNGNFGNPIQLAQFGEVTAVLISDFTFDDIPDVGYHYNGYFHVLVNDGTGNFTHQPYYNNLYQAQHIVKADFTGDGKDDVAFGSISSAAYSVLVADENNGYHEPVTFPYKGYLLSMTAPNVDGDDKVDIAISGWPYHYLSIGISLPRFDIFVHDTTRYYGYPNPEFKSTVVGWPGPNDLEINYKTPAVETAWIGDYEVAPVVSDSVSENFAVVKHPGVLTIDPAPLVITAVDTARLVRMPNPYFTYTITGLRNNDEYPIYLYCGAELESPAGEYPIIAQPAYGGNPNYAPTFIDGVLTIVEELVGDPYPSPSDGEFIAYSLEYTSYQIVDRAGRTMQSGNVVPGKNYFYLDARPGIYFLVFGNGVVHKIALR